jgi:hypothetical protein
MHSFIALRREAIQIGIKSSIAANNLLLLLSPVSVNVSLFTWPHRLKHRGAINLKIYLSS